ncbi:hypothetical protein J3L18_22345 [Mucilaginibacter gossypii]|uniref:hypothetical protein n=1 Tax=Mucilaginibacter gossypii TaxID=551996 RepID=UPI000DCF5A4D|nr:MULTISPECIES: hypothetical protein [Mucilaginibacter]QTE35867.1 hypothetical protein J3L18_22345 [Mucilaginibacter gossypii]RAV54673.1 hypothetical protein DIU36_20030 [Mucilaginibacter rubeus]
MKKLQQKHFSISSPADNVHVIALEDRQLKLGQLLKAVYTGIHTEETLQIIKQIKPKQNENN